MRVDLDAKVRTSDGKEAGTVQRAIVDSEGKEITDFVVSTGGLLGHDVIVPRHQLERASRDGDTIVLSITKEELGQLPPYTPANYVAPAAGWVPPSGFYLPPGGYLWPVSYPLPADEGPLLASRGAQEDASSARPSPEIRKGSTVRDRDGEEIGVVDDVRFEREGGYLTGLVVRLGGSLRTFFGGGETVAIAGSQIRGVEEGDVVRLRVLKEDLKHLPR